MANFRKVKIKDLLERVVGQEKVPKGNYLASGKYKIIDQGDSESSGFCNNAELLYKGPMPAIIFGDHTCRLKFIKMPFCLGADGTQIMYTKKINQTYFYYALKSLSFKISAYQRHYKLIKEKSILYPEDKETQTRIASVLSAYDDLIENNEKRIKALEEMAQLLYTEWFVKFKFPGYEKAKMIDSGTEYGMIPEGWEVVNIGNLLETVKRKAKLQANEYQIAGLYPIVDQGKDFIAGYTDDEAVIYSESLIVFGDHSRCFKYCNFPFACGADGTQLLKTNNTERMPQILLYYSVINAGLQNYNYARHFKFLKALNILKPDKETAKTFDKLVSQSYEQINKLRNQNQNLSKTRDLLIPQLVTGKRELK